MVAYGGYPWTIDDYLDLAAAYPFTWWASLDYCVEHEIAADRDEVLDRMSRTIRAAIECRVRACDRGIEAGFMPVVQGRWPQDRSEEHTSELQSLMRISYAVFCLKKNKYEI